jgi:hypothetical protein
VTKIVNGMIKNCVLEPVDSNVASNIDTMVENGAKVIHIYFHFQIFNGTLHGESEGISYRPLSWIRTTGRHGRSLLLLRHQYELFSLMSLSLGSEKIDVTVPPQIPPNCLTNKNATIVSQVLGYFILNKFKASLSPSNITTDDNILKATEHVCNLQISPRDGKALFYYICCHNALSSKVQCQELESDNYITILFVCIFLVNFLAVMFSPLLIPAKFYRNKFQKTSYEHKLKEPLTLLILKTYNKQKGENALPISHFEEMKEFRKTVEDMHIDIRYEVTLSKIDVVTEIDRLLPSNRVSVGLIESLYSALFNCEIRKKSSMKDCCKSNFLGEFTPFNNTLSWYKILRKIMQI